MQSVSLRLSNFHPYFFVSFSDEPDVMEYADRNGLPPEKPPAANAARRLMDHLNRKVNLPKHFENNAETGKFAVMDVKLEHLKVADIFRGVDEKGEIRKAWFYRIHFWNMSALKHYRYKIAASQLGLTWKARMYVPFRAARVVGRFHAPDDSSCTRYHEYDHFTQLNMLFGLSQLSYCQWVEFDGTQVKWVPANARDGFGGHSDKDWTDKEWTDRLKAHADEEADGYVCLLPQFL